MHWCETDCSYGLAFFGAYGKHMNFNARYYYHHTITCIKNCSHLVIFDKLSLSLISNQCSLIFMHANAFSFDFSLNTVDKYIQDL